MSDVWKKVHDTIIVRATKLSLGTMLAEDFLFVVGESASGESAPGASAVGSLDAGEEPGASEGASVMGPRGPGVAVGGHEL